LSLQIYRFGVGYIINRYPELAENGAEQSIDFAGLGDRSDEIADVLRENLQDVGIGQPPESLVAFL